MAKKLSDKPEAPRSNVTKGTVLTFLRRATGAQIAIDEMVGKKRAILKAAKSQGVNTKQLLALMAARKQDPEVLAEDRRLFDLYMHFAGLSIGAQGALFAEGEVDDKTTEREDGEQLRWEAEQEGYTAGKRNDPRDVNEYEPGSEEHVAFDTGWIRGEQAHAAIAKEMGEAAEREPQQARGRRRKGGNPEDRPEA